MDLVCAAEQYRDLSKAPEVYTMTDNSPSLREKRSSFLVCNNDVLYRLVPAF